MEAVSKGVCKTGGSCIGICTREIKREPNVYLKEIEWVNTYPLRLARFFDICDVFVFFDGGVGTFTELLLCLSLKTRDIGLHRRIFVIGINMKDKVKKVLSIIGEDDSYIKFLDSPEDINRFLINESG